MYNTKYIKSELLILFFPSNWMNMRDGRSGKLLWQSENWTDNLHGSEMEGTIFILF